MPKVNIKLPKELKELPETDRQQVLNTIAQAMELPKVVAPAKTGEHNIWEPNDEGLTGQLEDDFYNILADPWTTLMAELVVALDIPAEVFEKSLACDLIKGPKKPKVSDLINDFKNKRDKFLKYINDGKFWTKQQMQQLDSLLKQRLPTYAQTVEPFLVRAAFIGKLRSQAERDNLGILGAVLDRVPETIKASTKEGAKLATRDNRAVEVLPLTQQEQNILKAAEQQAASKITEVDQRTRAGIKQLVIRAKRERWSHQQLAQALFDKYGELNRDWRRVAITELSYAVNDSYLADLKEGDEVYTPTIAGACKHCQRLLEGKSFTFLSAPPEKIDHNTEKNYVWVGKSNYGRSTAAWVPCIPLHPQCRHTWQRKSKFYNMDESGKLKLKTTEELIQEERIKRGLGEDPELTEKLKKIREGLN